MICILVPGRELSLPDGDFERRQRDGAQAKAPLGSFRSQRILHFHLHLRDYTQLFRDTYLQISFSYLFGRKF